MKWSRDKKSGIYTSDNKRWKISNIDKKWVLQDTKSKKTYKDNTLKALQAKAVELEKSEVSNTKTKSTIKKTDKPKVEEKVVVEDIKETEAKTEVVKEEPKQEEPQVELAVADVVTPAVNEVGEPEVKKSFIGKRVDAKPSNKHLTNGLENFIPVEAKVLR